jgi:hypothetical protein
LLYRRLGAAEDRSTDKEDDPTEFTEFPRHVSFPVESFVEVPDEAILPHQLFFGGRWRCKVEIFPIPQRRQKLPCRRCGMVKIGYLCR